MAANAARTAGALCVILHDVAPARWAGCERVLAEVQACAQRAGVSVPMTLLVVPQMHGESAWPAPHLDRLRGWAGAGHELMLHGLTHRDDAAPPRRLREWLLRRHYTASEGEFAALTQPEALQRMQAGRTWARRQGLSMPGFVAPAWLLGPAGLEAATQAGFTHTCTLGQVISLPRRQALPAPSLVFSTRSAWRRASSVAWNRLLARRAQQAPLLRLELHPADADHPAVLRCWTELLGDALRERVPLRLREAAALARRQGR